MELPKKPAIMMFVGEQGSGKSHLIKAIIKDYGSFFRYGICMTGSKYNGDYSYLPDKCVWDGFDEDRFFAYIDKLREKVVAIKEDTKDDKANIEPNFIIFDDLLGEIPSKSKFKNWIFNFRHTNTYVFLTSQYLPESRGSAPFLRSSCHMAFLFPTPFTNSVESMFKAFGSMFEKKDYEVFKKMLLGVGKREHACLVYTKGKQSIRESYTSLVAPAVTDFKLEY